MSISFPKDQHISYLILHSGEKKRTFKKKNASTTIVQAIQTIYLSLSPNITKNIIQKK